MSSCAHCYRSILGSSRHGLTQHAWPSYMQQCSLHMLSQVHPYLASLLTAHGGLALSMTGMPYLTLKMVLLELRDFWSHSHDSQIAPFHPGPGESGALCLSSPHWCQSSPELLEEDGQFCEFSSSASGSLLRPFLRGVYNNTETLVQFHEMLHCCLR